MGGQIATAHSDNLTTADMVFEELPIVATETTVCRMIKKDFLARTQMKTAAKKKKAAKKPKKAKKKKRRKKKKAKKVIYGKGGRKKGAHKSKGFKASGKKRAAALKKAGKGIFKVKTLSADLAAITGKKKMNC